MKSPAVAIIFALIALRFIFIGDTPFINDEPWFVGFGLDFLETGKWLTLGLEGKMGVKYGPYTAWFFGALLAISKNLLTVVALKVFVISAIQCVASWFLWKSVENISKWFLVPIFASLYLFIYSRMLWDLQISLTFLAVSAYLYFLKEERSYKLLVSLIALVLSTLTHLMSLPTALAIGVHFLATRWRWMRENKMATLGLVAVFLVIGGPYYQYVLTSDLGNKGDFSLDHRSFFFAFFGSRFFTTFDFSYFLGKKWQVFSQLSCLTWLPYLVSFLGLGISLKRIFNDRLKAEPAILLGLLIVFFHLIFSFTSQLRTHPHYYNGAWMGMFLMLLIGLRELWKRKWFQKCYAVYLGALCFYLAVFIVKIHNDSGNRLPGYGPTLANQMAIAHELNAYAEEPVVKSEAWHTTTFPHTLAFIRKLDRLDNPDRVQLNEATSFVIKYQSESTQNGALVLVPAN
jgi:4-amino-4-deoxy-L-arabinose transferase-like glycosyltransferase